MLLRAGCSARLCLTRVLMPRCMLFSTPETAIRFLYKDAEHAASPTPDLIFIDYRLPSNGGGCCPSLKGDPNLRAIPVVAMSIDASPEQICAIYGRHANCCINKPVNASDLTDDMRSALTFLMDVALMRKAGGGLSR